MQETTQHITAFKFMLRYNCLYVRISLVKDCSKMKQMRKKLTINERIIVQEI